MTKLFTVIFALVFSFASLHAQEKKSPPKDPSRSPSIVGYLVDLKCGKNMVKAGSVRAMEKAARHTKKCALNEDCAADGYGLVSEGKFYSLDDAGNKKAKDFLTKTEKEADIKVEISGVLSGDTIAVESIHEYPRTVKKGKARK